MSSVLTNNKKNFSIISNGLTIKGDMLGNASVEIEGELIGKLVSQTATISEIGRVVGDIYADVVNINGTVEGIVRARAISITSSANVKGTIEYTKISVENGAVILGDFKQIEMEEDKDIMRSFNEGDIDEISVVEGGKRNNKKLSRE